MSSRQSSVNDLSDEIISLIIHQLHDPGPLSMTCRRFYEISRDPYVRASYFLVRYGKLHAFYWALSRGRLINERVLDILQTSGAHLSRYLIQVAIHHYFRTTTHFTKNQWARSVPYHIFIHFMTFAKRYGTDLPLNKGEDDGAIFQAWLKERLNTGYGRKIELDVIKNLFQKYDFMVFSPKDPLTTQLPLAFAIEPSLLPLAICNGFYLDSRYRDFIFRKMFEKSNKAGKSNEIAQNVRQMTRLDKRMFLSRTVAAEVCMECRSNESGYSAIKLLESSNDLRFSLRELVHDLLQLFLKTRSVTHQATILTLQTLFRDFSSTYGSPSPASMPDSHQSFTSRQVMFITIFCAVPRSGIYFADIQEPLPSCLPSHGKITCDILLHKLKNLGLLPVTRQDLLDVLVSPWCEEPGPLLTWAKEEMEMSPQDLQALVEEAAVQSLSTNCKGKLFQRLFENHSSSITDRIETEVLTRYQIDERFVPDHRIADCSSFQTHLNVGLESKDRSFAFSATHAIIDDEERVAFVADLVGDEEPFEVTFSTRDSETAVHELGLISQDTLSYRIQLDTENNLRIRRRHWPIRFLWQSEMQLKKSYPCDAMTIGQWIYDIYGPRHPVTAIFMTHAIINMTNDILKVYLNDSLPYSRHVPITMKHFHIMAKLGRDPSWLVWQAVKDADFYMTEDDYVELNRCQADTELPISVKMMQTTSESDSSHGGCRKRPRRITVSTPSYLIPDSDDEAIQEDGLFVYKDRIKRRGKKKARVKSSLQKWVKHLSILLKEEEKKYKEKKKRTPKDKNGKSMSRCLKSEFMKSLTNRLRELRDIEVARIMEVTIGTGEAAVSGSDTDCYDEEFVLPAPRSKKRRLEV